MILQDGILTTCLPAKIRPHRGDRDARFFCCQGGDEWTPGVLDPQKFPQHPRYLVVHPTDRVGEWNNPGDFNGISGGKSSTYNWGELTHLRFVGWTTKYPQTDGEVNRHWIRMDLLFHLFADGYNVKTISIYLSIYIYTQSPYCYMFICANLWRFARLGFADDVWFPRWIWV